MEPDLLLELDTLCVAQAMRAVTAFEGDIPPLSFVNPDPRAFTRRPSQVPLDAVDGRGEYRMATNPTG